MKVQIASDLHLEFGANLKQGLIQPAGDVLVIAGDLHVGLEETILSLIAASNLFGGAPIVFVPGNHEYYESDYCHLRELFSHQRSKLTALNIHLLDRETVTLNGVRFIGATGWTDGSYMKYDPQLPYGLTDLRVIPGFREANGGQDWGRDDIAFIIHELEHTTPETEKTVVVTHHVPTPLSLSARFLGDIHNAFFISDWTHVLEEFKPDLWVHGHTHTSFDYKISGTRVVCNPYGYYLREMNTGYSDSLTVEV